MQRLLRLCLAIKQIVPKATGYIGVDPGAKGQLCLLVPSLKHLTEWFPCSEPPKKILGWLAFMGSEFNVPMIMIEAVHSLHMMSAKSNFTFGYNLGTVTALCQATGIGVDTVTPKIWQKRIGIVNSKSVKKDVAKVCQTIYPSLNIFGPKGGLDDGKSDSLMIAHYLFKQLTK